MATTNTEDAQLPARPEYWIVDTLREMLIGPYLDVQNVYRHLGNLRSFHDFPGVLHLARKADQYSPLQYL